MLKRILLIVSAIAVVTALAGAGIVVAGNKVVIVQPSERTPGARWILGSIHGPQPGAIPGQTLTITSPTPPKGISPNVSLQGGPISCVSQEFSTKIGSSTIGGQDYTNCTAYVTEDVTIYAEYCAPVLWGCEWQVPGPEIGSCIYTVSFTSMWCPYNGTFNYWGIPPGQLWRTRAHVKIYFPGIGSGEGDTTAQVQF